MAISLFSHNLIFNLIAHKKNYYLSKPKSILNICCKTLSVILLNKI